MGSGRLAQRLAAASNRAVVVELPQVVSQLAADVARLARARVAPTARVLLFGSWARGAAAPRSDLDLAIDAGAPIRPALMQRLAFDCEELRTLRKIDLVDLQSADPELRAAILRDGIEL